MNWFSNIFQDLRELFSAKPPLKTFLVSELPDILEPNTVYVIGEEGYKWCAALLCPCGCNKMLQMNLLTGHPRWHLTEHWNGTVTLHPSVWRKKECCSHFYLRRGRIIWVNYS